MSSAFRRPRVVVHSSDMLGQVQFRGVEYRSLHAAARARGLSGAMVIARVRRGWSVTSALSTPPIARERPITANGVTYASTSGALAAAGVSESTIRARVERGLGLSEAFAVGKRRRGPEPDPISAAAIAAGLDRDLVKARLRLGWTLARALAVPPAPRGRRKRANAA